MDQLQKTGCFCGQNSVKEIYKWRIERVNTEKETGNVQAIYGVVFIIIGRKTLAYLNSSSVSSWTADIIKETNYQKSPWNLTEIWRYIQWSFNHNTKLVHESCNQMRQWKISQRLCSRNSIKLNQLISDAFCLYQL